MLQKGVSGTVVRNYVNHCINIEHSASDKASLLNDKHANSKREEVQTLALEYSLNEVVVKRVAKNFLMNEELKCGTILKSVDFLAYILKKAFNYNDEEISEFLNRNSLIMISSYGDFRTRLAIFNHFGMFEDVIFKGAAFLGHDFTQAHFGTRGLYALIMKYNITCLDELRDLVEKTSKQSIVNLIKEFPLTNDEIQELDEELKKKIRKESFKRELERRKSLKM